MKIIAVSVGTRGDVKPLIELGMEMISRDYSEGLEAVLELKR